MNHSIFLREDLDILVVSYGGVGTTFLMREIAKYYKVNHEDNLDGLKHIPIPPINLGRPIKVVYVFGDPAMATVSLFRRAYHHTQSRCTQQFRFPKQLIPLSTTLEAYLADGKDKLLLADHFNNWRHTPCNYPILFLRYDSIHDELETLKSFLALPDSFINNFPARYPRKSSLDALSTDNQLKLATLVGTTFANTIEALPNTWIKMSEGRWALPTTKLYRMAYYYSVRKYLRRLIRRS